MSTEICALRHGVKLSLQTLPYEIIKRLSELYVDLRPTAPPDAFTDDHFNPMLNDPKLDPTAMEQFIYTGMDGKDVQYIDLLRQSCAYCVATIRADKRGERNAAWIFASFSQYWLGLANGIRFVSGAGELAFALKGRKGGLQKDEDNYKNAREHAIELAKNYLQFSAASAARQIHRAIVEFQEEVNKGSYAPSEQTITEWLRASDLAFGTKRIPRRSNTKKS